MLRECIELLLGARDNKADAALALVLEERHGELEFGNDTGNGP